MVKVATMEDAQMAISQLNRRKIGYRRIRVGFFNADEQKERRNRRHFALNPAIQQRSQYDAKMHMMRLPVDNAAQCNRRKDDKIGFATASKTPNVCLPKMDDPLCPRHRPKDPRQCIQIASQQCMPVVMISLADLRPNVVRLLQEHDNLLSAVSFTRCYEETFGPLNKAEAVNGEEHDKDEETPQHNPPVPTNYVSLEHLVTCVADVSIQRTVNGVKVVTLSQANPQETAPGSASPDAASQTLFTKESLRQFRREVVELVKQQAGSALPLSKFIPTYHAYFGKQCRVSDYGFSRLQDLIEALRGIVHVVGEGPLRTIMLTHVIQVRRFTHDLLRLLKGEQKKAIPIAQLPRLYEAVFHKPFMPTNYGVCSIYDLLNDLSESKLVLESSGEEGPSVVVPRRIQTPEQWARTQLFAIEVVDMLSTTERFQITFTKFIPAYHHAFNHQCRVAEYGFSKFIELLEAIPHVVEVLEENGERYITLVASLRLALIRQMLLEILEAQTLRRLPLGDLVSVFLTRRQLVLLPQDYGFDTLEEMCASFPEVFLLQQQQQQQQQQPEQLTPSAPPSIALSPQEPVFSTVGDGPRVDSVGPEEVKAETTVGSTTATYVCLEDRHKIKQTACRCLQILLNSPFGSVAEAEFKEHFRATFQEEVDLDLIHAQMAPFISVKDCNVQMHQQEGLESVSMGRGPSEAKMEVGGYRMIQLCPLILFARQLRFLLMRTRGRLMLSLVEQMYRRHFGVALRPEAYGYPSLLTLVNAVNFVVAVRGRGTRAVLFLAQDYLGKLAWTIAYKLPFRHDLINQHSEEDLETGMLPQSVVPGRQYLPPAGAPYPPIHHEISNFSWHYDNLLESNEALSPGATRPTAILPVDAFPIDRHQLQQSMGYPSPMPNSFVPGLVAQGCCLPETLNAPVDCTYGMQGQRQEPAPPTHIPLIGYPGQQPLTEEATVTPAYIPLYITNGKTPTPVWAEAAEQPAPPPFYALATRPPFSSVPQLTAYGYTDPNCVHPLLPISQPETEISINPLNPSIAPLASTSLSQAGQHLDNTVDEKQNLTEMLSLGNNEVQPLLNCPPATYHTIPHSSTTSWFSQATQQIWAPGLAYPHSQTTVNSCSFDGHLLPSSNSGWTTSLNQWVGAYRMSPQWPFLQPTSMGLQSPGQPAVPIADPQALTNGTMVFNGQLCMGNALLLNHTPCLSEAGPNTSPPVNKCEEGEWTLPISMTTESVDVNSKENDETCSVE